MSKVEELLDAIGSLTVLEAAELKEMMEDKFGVTAAAPVAMAVAGGAAQADAEEQTEFDVVLVGIGDKKIQVIKAVREITSVGLKDAKAIVDAIPAKVREGVTKDEAEVTKKKLEEAGATVEVV